MKPKSTITICLVLLLNAGCGDLGDKAKEQVRQIVIEEVNKAVAIARAEAEAQLKAAKAEAEAQLKAAKAEADRKLKKLTDENSELRKKVEMYEGAGKKWLRYVTLALYVLGAITAIKLFGKPIARMAACIVLKHWSPRPRKILPIQTKGKKPDETRLEPA